MAYRLELSQPYGMPLYLEFVLSAGGIPLTLGSNTHSFAIGRGWDGCRDWDRAWWDGGSLIEATDENGMISVVDPGTLVVSIPAAQLQSGFGFDHCMIAPFRLVGNPSTPFMSLLAEGTITFGDRR